MAKGGFATAGSVRNIPEGKTKIKVNHP